MPSISEAEYRVLSCLELEGGLADSEGILMLADAVWVTNPLPVAEYTGAIDARKKCGWIKVITEEDRWADTERWAEEPHQTLGETPYRVGSLDFTPEGWEIFVGWAQRRRRDVHEARFRNNGSPFGTCRDA